MVSTTVSKPTDRYILTRYVVAAQLALSMILFLLCSPNSTSNFILYSQILLHTYLHSYLLCLSYLDGPIIMLIKLMYWHFFTNLDWYPHILVFYQLCHLSLVIPVLSLAIPGLSLLFPSHFQDVPDSSCLMFYQQYINLSNKPNLLRTMI